MRHRRRFRLSEKIVEDPDEEAKEGLIDKETQVNGSDQDSHKKDTEKADEDEHEHRDEYQVQLDVNRSFINYPLGLLTRPLPSSDEAASYLRN